MSHLMKMIFFYMYVILVLISSGCANTTTQTAQYKGYKLAGAYTNTGDYTMFQLLIWTNGNVYLVSQKHLYLLDNNLNFISNLMDFSSPSQVPYNAAIDDNCLYLLTTNYLMKYSLNSTNIWDISPVVLSTNTNFRGSVVSFNNYLILVDNVSCNVYKITTNGVLITNWASNQITSAGISLIAVKGDDNTLWLRSGNWYNVGRFDSNMNFSLFVSNNGWEGLENTYYDFPSFDVQGNNVVFLMDHYSARGINIKSASGFVVEAVDFLTWSIYGDYQFVKCGQTDEYYLVNYTVFGGYAAVKIIATNYNYY